MLEAGSNKPFPLKRHYVTYAGIGAIVFYTLLLLLFMHAEREALYEEYIHSVSDKARSLYFDVERDFLRPNGIYLNQLDPSDQIIMDGLRHEIDDIVQSDFSLAKVKLIRADALMLYDNEERANEGALYTSRDESGFKTARNGEIAYDIEQEDDGRRLIELYLPILDQDSRQLIAVLEIYEDITRFETQAKAAMQHALAAPTAAFILFNIVLFMIVAKADKIISRNTRLLISIRHDMEKYLSQSAVNAIYQAASTKKELFRGDRQELVVFFSDVRGFTRFSETTEPEAVVLALNKVFQIQAEIIHRHEGIIDKFVGDEIMAIFPANQAAAAAGAALEILEALATNKDIALQVGIGIHAGEAVVGTVGTAERRDYTAIGDTINTGARLCAAAEAGGVIISDSAYAQLDAELQALFPAEALLELKGKSGKLKTHAGRWLAGMMTHENDAC